MEIEPWDENSEPKHDVTLNAPGFGFSGPITQEELDDLKVWFNKVNKRWRSEIKEGENATKKFCKCSTVPSINYGAIARYFKANPVCDICRKPMDYGY